MMFASTTPLPHRKFMSASVTTPRKRVCTAASWVAESLPAWHVSHADDPRELGSLRWTGAAHIAASRGVAGPQLGQEKVAQARSHLCRDAWS